MHRALIFGAAVGLLLCLVAGPLASLQGQYNPWDSYPGSTSGTGEVSVKDTPYVPSYTPNETTTKEPIPEMSTNVEDSGDVYPN